MRSAHREASLHREPSVSGIVLLKQFVILDKRQVRVNVLLVFELKHTQAGLGLVSACSI